MKSSARLDTRASGLTSMLAKVSVSRRRVASSTACEMAIRQTEIGDAVVTAALERFRAGGVLKPPEIARLEALVDELDRQYFDAQADAERGEAFEADYLHLFSKARAVAALAFAGTADTPEAASEAIYEAAAAVGDRSDELLARVKSLLVRT